MEGRMTRLIAVLIGLGVVGSSAAQVALAQEPAPVPEAPVDPLAPPPDPSAPAAAEPPPLQPIDPLAAPAAEPEAAAEATVEAQAPAIEEPEAPVADERNRDEIVVTGTRIS